MFVSIQTAAYGTTSVVDTGRATSMFNTQRQIAYAAGVAVAATVIAVRRLDASAATVRRPSTDSGRTRRASSSVGLIMLPAAIVAWFIDDDDVAETRGLTRPNTEPALVD